VGRGELKTARHVHGYAIAGAHAARVEHVLPAADRESQVGAALARGDATRRIELHDGVEPGCAFKPREELGDHAARRYTMRFS